ncbi:MAG: hypothetical protein HUU04_02375 [Verrucomicrobiae bacterium]|nr:hypothetical protein [Verrucomicrobiae bacterium]
MEEWKIQPRGEACSACRRPFEPKEICHTVLADRAGQLLREDLCETCWLAQGGADVRARVGVISTWQGAYEPPAPPPPDPLPRQDAESILRRMMARELPEEAEARYILAVMLERKRVFRHRETRGGEPPLLVYEHAATGEAFLIPDPRLRLDQIAAVQQRVAAMLTGGDPAPPEPTVAST